MRMKHEKLEQCQAMIRDAGLRATASRVAVLALLLSEEAALSHAEVSECLETASWGRATLYRNLVDMAEVGILRRVELGDHTWRFEVKDAEHQGDEHPHFVCSECGTVECLPEVEFRTASRKVPQAIRAKNVEVQMRGICDECA